MLEERAVHRAGVGILGPLQDAVKAEVVGAALRGAQGLVSEGVEADGAALRVVIRVEGVPRLQCTLVVLILRIRSPLQGHLVLTARVVFRVPITATL